MDDQPKPGSNEAIKLGCTCPVLDNGHGAGYMGQSHIFVYTAGCPVHPVHWGDEDAQRNDDPLPHPEDDA